jgi:hypothetical protein
MAPPMYCSNHAKVVMVFMNAVMCAHFHPPSINAHESMVATIQGGMLCDVKEWVSGVGCMHY